jgi:transposase
MIRSRKQRLPPETPNLKAVPFRQAERKLDAHCTTLTAIETETASATAPSDAAILPSLPGVGRTTLATLLSEAPGPLSRRDRNALRTLYGVAPVTKRSGKTCIVVMRYAAQMRLRQAVFHWARTAVQNDPKSRSRYEALRARGHSYGRALRGVADRLLGVACVLLQRRELFNPQHGMTASA